jgi:nicotinate-nucleotide adenylyltransferase
MNMLELAVESCPGLGISTLEYDRKGISYTIDTLRTLRTDDPPVEPLFLIGGDVLAELQTWKMYRELLAEFDLAVISRPEDPRDRATPAPEVERRIVDYPGTGPDRPHCPGRGGRIFRLRIDPVPISSTAVRRAVSLGRPIHGLVPLSVAKYIQNHQLYRREVQL